MAVTERIITAIHYRYEGGTEKVSITTLYFNDGTKLDLDGYWVLKVGHTYCITHNGTNPADVESITMLV